MKRAIVILTMIFGFTTLYAQTGVQINFDQLKKKVDRSNEDILNPKKNIKESTWMSRAELMMEIFDSQMMKAYVGMDVPSFNLIVGQPKDRTQEEVDGALVEKFVMDRVNFYFVSGRLEKWEVTNPIVEKPLDAALEAINKVVEIDVKGKKTKDVKELLTRLKGLYISEGSNCYAFKNYEGAYRNFLNVISIGRMPQLNHQDTVIYYYTGLSAQLAAKYQEAIDMYKQALALDYKSDGGIYFNIYDAYKSLNDADNGVTYLEQGFTKYPNNQNILFSLINHYLTKGDDPSKILVYIEKAIKEEPGNASLYFAKGTLHDKLGDFEEAVASYEKAAQVDPMYFDAYYNIGALYYNRAVKYIEEANKVPAKEVQKYDDLMAKAAVEFKNALPYMEKADQVKPNDKNALESLKNIYFRFRTESEEMNKKYLEYNEKLKNL